MTPHMLLAYNYVSLDHCITWTFRKIINETSSVVTTVVMHTQWVQNTDETLGLLNYNRLKFSIQTEILNTSSFNNQKKRKCDLCSSYLLQINDGFRGSLWLLLKGNLHSSLILIKTFVPITSQSVLFTVVSEIDYVNCDAIGCIIFCSLTCHEDCVWNCTMHMRSLTKCGGKFWIGMYGPGISSSCDEAIITIFTRLIPNKPFDLCCYISITNKLPVKLRSREPIISLLRSKLKFFVKFIFAVVLRDVTQRSLKRTFPVDRHSWVVPKAIAFPNETRCPLWKLFHGLNVYRRNLFCTFWQFYLPKINFGRSALRGSESGRVPE